MGKRKKHKREALEEQTEEQPVEEPTADEPSEEAETEATEPSEEASSDDIFEVDTGKKGRGKSAIDIDKFKDCLERVEAAMEKLDSNAVKITLTQINKLLGTSVSNNNSFAYRLKTGKDTKPILAEHNLYVGSRGSWNGAIEDQRIAFVKLAQ